MAMDYPYIHTYIHTQSSEITRMAMDYPVVRGQGDATQSPDAAAVMGTPTVHEHELWLGSSEDLHGTESRASRNGRV